MAAKGETQLYATLEPARAEMAEDVSCWMATTDRPGFHVWSNRFVAGQKRVPAAWSTARERLSGRRIGDPAEQTGMFRDGKRIGYRVERCAAGAVNEGPYVNDKRHGYWMSTGRIMSGKVSVWTVDGTAPGFGAPPTVELTGKALVSKASSMATGSNTTPTAPSMKVNTRTTTGTAVGPRAALTVLYLEYFYADGRPRGRQGAARQ